MMKVGFAEADISVFYDTQKAGSYRKVYLDKKLDSLMVRSAVFDNGKTMVALVGVDTCYLSAAQINKAKAVIQQTCAIDPGNIIIAASHTHCGGLAANFNNEPRFDPDKSTPEKFKGKIQEINSKPDPLYQKLLLKRIIGTVISANNNKEDALINSGKGFAFKVAFNRRFRMKNGKTYTHPGKCNPNILEVAGPVDPEVGVVGAWRDNGRLIGCIVNYSCHATCSDGKGWSADYIYYLVKTIRKQFGSDTAVVFLNGACGDITHVDNLRHDNDSSAEKLGTKVGAEAIKVLINSAPKAYKHLDAKTVNIPIARRPLKKELLLQAEKTLQSNDPPIARLALAKEKVLYAELYKQYPVAGITICAIKIADSIFISNPGEFFCELGLDVKKNVCFDNTFVVSLANGVAGYVPTPKSFDPRHGGGYETILTTYSNLCHEAGRIIAGAMTALGNEFTPEKLDIKAQAPGGPGGVPGATSDPE